MGEETVTTESPQLAFAFTDDDGQPLAEAPPTEPTDVSPEEVERLMAEEAEKKSGEAKA